MTHRYGRRVVMVSVLFLSTARTVSSMASEDAATAKVETESERAHLAQKSRLVSPERVGGYKQRLRKMLPEGGDFDRYWQLR
jgi:hypothetical protein